MARHHPSVPQAAALLAIAVAVAAGGKGSPAALPQVSVADARSAEAGSLGFAVSVSERSDQPITVQYATHDGSAVAGQDYSASSGSVIIPPGNTVAVISVPVLEDALDERDETLTVQLSAPVHAALADATASGTIIDDDPTAGGPPASTSPIVALGLAAGEARGVAPAEGFVTRSIAPTADALVVLQVAVGGDRADLPATVQGAGLQFERLAEVRPYVGSPRTLGFYVAQRSRIGSGVLRMTWTPGSGGPYLLAYTVTQYAGVAVGTNGRSALAQVQYNPNHVNSTSTQGLVNPLQSERNAVAAFFLAGVRGQDIVPEEGWTEVSSVISSSTIFSLAATFRRGGGDLTPAVSWQRASSNQWLALEVVAAPKT